MGNKKAWLRPPRVFGGCVLKMQPPRLHHENQNLHILHHLHRFLRLSTSILIHPENTGWRWLKKVFTGTSCSSSQTFPSFRFIRRMRWWSRMNSLRSIPVLLFLQTCHPTRQSTLPDSLHFGYFGIMQVIQHGRYTQQQVPMCSDVFV